MLKRLYVNNFRCLDNFEIDLDRRSAALLIGKNGSGKSALLSALSLLQTIGRGSSRTSDLIGKADFSHYRTQVPVRVEVDLNLAGKSARYNIAFEYDDRLHQAFVAEESLEYGGADVFVREGSEVSLASGVELLVPTNNPALSLIQDQAHGRDSAGVADFLASMILIAPIPANMSGFAEQEVAYIESDVANLAGYLNFLLGQHPSAYETVSTYLRSIIPDFDSFENIRVGETGKKLRLVFANERQPTERFSVDFENLSDGEKCFFLSAMIVAKSKKQPTFCMWDEPDNHLSLPEVRHFTTALRKAMASNGQFIATSHHPETIRSFSDDTTFVLSRKSHLEPTILRPLNKIGYNGDLIEALIRDEIFD